jgi:hypothetical protein
MESIRRTVVDCTLARQIGAMFVVCLNMVPRMTMYGTFPGAWK